MSLNNKVLITGRLTRDAESRPTGNGGTAVNFSVAINEKWTGDDGEKKEHVEYIPCAFFGKRASALAQYLTKGTSVSVEGKWRSRKWQDKNGVERLSVECHVRDIELRGGGNKRDGGATGGSSHDDNHESAGSEDFGEIPF